MKVKATDKFIKHNVNPKELDHIPTDGEKFEVSDERFKILTGDNRFNEVFVEEVKEEPVKRERKKKVE